MVFLFQELLESILSSSINITGGEEKKKMKRKSK